MHIAQYWSAVQECEDHAELTILAVMAFEDEEISKAQSLELGDEIKKRREELTGQGITLF